MKAFFSLITALFTLNAWSAEPNITLTTTRNITDWAKYGQEQDGFEFKAVSSADTLVYFHGFNCVADSENEKLIDGLYLFLFAQREGVWGQLFVFQIDGVTPKVSTLLFAKPFLIGPKETVQFRVRFATAVNAPGELSLGLSRERVEVKRILELVPKIAEALPALSGSVIPGATAAGRDVPVRVDNVGISKFTVYQVKVYPVTFSVVAGGTYELQYSQNLNEWTKFREITPTEDRVRINWEIPTAGIPVMFLRLIPAP